MAETGPGKLRRLALLADWDGHLQLLAADQGDTALAAGVAVGLSGQASGVLVTPAAWPDVAAGLDRGCAGVLALDADGNLAEGLLHALRAGATAVAWRLTWHAVEEQRAAKLNTLAMLSEECAKQGLPLLVILDCPPTSPDRLSAAVRGPQIVEAVTAVTAEERQVDLLAVPFPADLRYVAEFAGGALDGEAREPVGDLAEVSAALEALDAACRAPWLLWAEGEPEVWLTSLRLAIAHGASGFVASHSTWDDAPAEGLAEGRAGPALHRWRRAIALSSSGRAWHDRPAEPPDTPASEG